MIQIKSKGKWVLVSASDLVIGKKAIICQPSMPIVKERISKSSKKAYISGCWFVGFKFYVKSKHLCK